MSQPALQLAGHTNALTIANLGLPSTERGEQGGVNVFHASGLGNALRVCYALRYHWVRYNSSYTNYKYNDDDDDDDWLRYP